MPLSLLVLPNEFFRSLLGGELLANTQTDRLSPTSGERAWTTATTGTVRPAAGPRSAKSEQRQPCIGRDKTIQCLLLRAGKKLLEFGYEPVPLCRHLVLRGSKRNCRLSYRRRVG